MATELEGIKEVTEAILGIGEIAIDNYTFKVNLNIKIIVRWSNFSPEAFLQMVSVPVHLGKCPGPGKPVLRRPYSL